MFGTSPNYFFDVDGEADWDLSDVNAPTQPMEHTVLKPRLTAIQETFRRDDVVGLRSMIDVVGFVPGRVLAPVPSEVSSNDALWHIAEVSDLKVT